MDVDLKFIDLHIHTNKSDGTFNVDDIVNFAIQNKTKIIAIADHDTIDGMNELQKYLKDDMYGINGVEFSSYIKCNGSYIRIHILGYGFNKDDTGLIRLLQIQKQKRLTAHLNLLKFLKEDLKCIPEERISKLDLERYCWFDREVIRCMQEENYSVDVIGYYKDFFRKNRFSYGSDYDLEAKVVIEAIKAAGGYSIFAHPMDYKLERLIVDLIIAKLISLGIDGIEVYQSDCSIEDSNYLMNIVQQNKLLYSVGSDFHRMINTDGRMIGRGINDNLCITETSLTDKLLKKKLYFKGIFKEDK